MNPTTTGKLLKGSEEPHVVTPCITLWQPWATFIALGWKTIETRTHGRFNKLEGKVIGIHAGKKFDTRWKEFAGPYMTREQIALIQHCETYNKAEIPSGKLLCTAYVERVDFLDKEDSKKAMIDCDPVNTLRQGLYLYDVRILPWAVWIQGHQGIWYYEGRLP